MEAKHDYNEKEQIEILNAVYSFRSFWNTCNVSKIQLTELYTSYLENNFLGVDSAGSKELTLSYDNFINITTTYRALQNLLGEIDLVVLTNKERF